MPFEPQSQPWSGKHAVLLVHGIGNSRPSDASTLLDAVRASLGPTAGNVAIYQLFYDHINDWFVEKTGALGVLTQAVRALGDMVDDPELGGTIAEYVGDVLWPVLSSNARGAIREAYLAQVMQMVLDGRAAGVPSRRQKLSIVAHSLGCFHTYEALHFAAKFKTHNLMPATHEVVFDNVILMASPVQLIRSVANGLDKLVPNRQWLETIQGDTLSIPSEKNVLDEVVPSVRHWISVTGKLDPVGGHFFRRRADWAYMNVPGQESIVVDQFATDVTSKAELITRLKSSALSGSTPTVSPRDPHSWLAYVQGNGSLLQNRILG